MNGQTIISYGGGTPTITGTVTLFNSVTSFPPGGSLHLLGQQWFQLTVAFGTAADGGTGTVTGDYSDDKGTTWRRFYTKGSIPDAVTATPASFEDEIYIGAYKDVRFQWVNAGEAPTVFQVAMAVNHWKATSKVTANDLVVDG